MGHSRWGEGPRDRLAGAVFLALGPGPLHQRRGLPRGRRTVPGGLQR
ncbi:MAG: hypothetical protein WDN45_01350 [Caulobacteraceae bacterium]